MGFFRIHEWIMREPLEEKGAPDPSSSEVPVDREVPRPPKPFSRPGGGPQRRDEFTK